jgi:formate-dependent nitrite reductase membrane component NrfD
MTEHYWGWLVAIYLFMGGMGAGAFIVAAVLELSGERYKHEYCPTTLVGSGVSGLLITIGTVLLIFDLGAGLREPWRIINMFTNWSSVMTWGIWILSFFIPTAFVYAILELMHVYPGILEWLRKWLKFLPETLPYRAFKRVVCSIGILLAVGTAVYTGVLLSVVDAVPFWATPLLPALFLVSALSTGMGLSLDLSASLIDPEAAHRFKRLPLIHVILIGLEVILLALLLYTGYQQGGEAAESVQIILTGAGSLIFWVVVAGLGLLFPLAINVYALVRGSHGYVVGILAGAAIVLAGLFVRFLVLAAAVPVTV